MLYEYEGEGAGRYDSYAEGEGEYKGEYAGASRRARRAPTPTGSRKSMLGSEHRGGS